MACPVGDTHAPRAGEEPRRVRPRRDDPPDQLAAYLKMHRGAVTHSHRLLGLQQIVLSASDQKTLCMDARDDMQAITAHIGGCPANTTYFEAKCARAV